MLLPGVEPRFLGREARIPYTIPTEPFLRFKNSGLLDVITSLPRKILLLPGVEPRFLGLEARISYTIRTELFLRFKNSGLLDVITSLPLPFTGFPILYFLVILLRDVLFDLRY